MAISDNIANQANITRNLVGEKFKQAKEYANSAWNEALSYIAQLGQLVAAPTVPDLDVNFEDIPTAITSEISSKRPEGIDDTQLIFNEIPLPELGPLMDYPVTIYPGSTIDSVRQAILNKVLSDITNGSTGLSAEVEAAIWDRAIARTQLKTAAMYREAEEYFSSRGFELPPGTLSGRLLEIQAEINRANTDINSDIMVKSAELALDNQKFIIREGAAMMAQIEANKIQLVASNNESMVKVYAAQLERYRADVLKEQTRIESIVKAYLGKVEAYKADAQVDSVLIDSQIKVIEAKIKNAAYKTEILVKEAEIEIEKAKMLHSIQVEALRAGAQVSAQLAASAMASVNASAAMGYSAGSNEGVSFSEGHSYDETKATPTTHNQHNYDET